MTPDFFLQLIGIIAAVAVIPLIGFAWREHVRLNRAIFELGEMRRMNERLEAEIKDLEEQDIKRHNDVKALMRDMDNRMTSQMMDMSNQLGRILGYLAAKTGDADLLQG